ncbi:MAG: hypothetical protein NZ553_07995 [Caldilinea sp.]|nr:hypothetical protein [Caldilinea sp.]MDW8440396.1 hypothetical protein [Caldilineaceae bacterium]
MPIYVSYLAEGSDEVSTGVRVVVPVEGSPQAQRGAFCALVDLHGVPDVELLTERVLSAMQRTYYSERGTQSHVITETARRAQALIAAEVERHSLRWRAGVVCVGILADRLALIGVGSAFALVTNEDGSVGVFPPDRLAAHQRGEEATLALWPLHRQKIGASTAMLAASGAWLDLVPVRTLAGTAAYVEAESCIDAADGLRKQAGRGDVPGFVMVIEPNPTNAASPPALSGDEHPTPPSSSPDRSAGGLPTALNASPPIIRAPEAPPTEDAPSASSTQPTLRFGAAERAQPEAPFDRPLRFEDAEFDGKPTAKSAKHSAQRSPAARLATKALDYLEDLRAFAAGILPERNPASATPLMAQATSAGAYTSPSSPPPKVRPAPEPLVLPPPTTGGRARLFVTLAVILLCLIPAVVGTLYWRQAAVGAAEAEQLVKLAEARYATAVQALDQEDATTARALLTEAAAFVRRAEEIGGRTERSVELMQLIERDRMAVERITFLYGLTLPLISFPPERAPQQLMVIGPDIYVLDGGRNEILYYRLGPDGESLTSSDAQIVLRMGESVGSVTVGAPIDLAWQPPIPGYDDKSSLLVLDDNNQIFRYNHQVDGASLVRFGDGPQWIKATQIETYLGRLYVADEGTNQIYRYEAGAYNNPISWFQVPTLVNLSNLAAMRIDGDIWLLYKDGKVVRYRSGEQLPFGLDNSITPPAEGTDLWVGQDGDDAVYLVDRLLERILVFDKESGAYLEQFQAAEGAPLRNLRAIFVDRAHNVQYILAGNNLFQESLPR